MVGPMATRSAGSRAAGRREGWTLWVRLWRRGLARQSSSSRTTSNAPQGVEDLSLKRRRESAGPQACLLLSGQNGLS